MSVQLRENHTDHLTLRIAEAADMDTIFNQGTEEEQMRILGIENFEKLKEERAKHKEGLSTHNRKFVHFFISEKGQNEVIGWCGYHTWYTDHNRAELGYAFFSNSPKGKGWMSEVVAKVIPYGFDEMNLHRIEAMVGVNNMASLRILEKFGFEKEGHLREHYLRPGIYEDSLVFSLLRADCNRNIIFAKK